jgi:dTDP-L-rhamnose 4-epimerase
MLCSALNSFVSIRVTSQYRLGDIRHNYADTSRLSQLMPVHCNISLTEGLSRFADWVLTQPLPTDNLEKANAELRKRKLMV